MTKNLPSRRAGYIERRQTTYWDLRFHNGDAWRVHFRSKREFAFAKPGGFGFVRLLKRHPLLLDYQASWQSVYLSQKVADPLVLVEQLYQIVCNSMAGWRPAMRYLNTKAGLEQLLKDGYGLVYEAPLALSRKMLNAFRRAQVKVSVFSDERPVYPVQVLIMGSSYVVAEQFRYDRIDDTS